MKHPPVRYRTGRRALVPVRCHGFFVGSSSRGRLPGAIIALGWTSFFTDVGSDMVVPLLPMFLASLGASAAALGAIEGAAEATASFLKLGSGFFADRTVRKKPIVLFGYGIATAARPLIALAMAPWHVLAIRVIDRVGKGVRTAPRDVMIAAHAAPGESGRAFGFHRAMDHAGAVVGPLVATGLLALGFSTRAVFAFAIVPGVFAILALLTVREPPVAGDAHADRPTRASQPTSEPNEHVQPQRAISRSLRLYLGVLAVFALGSSSDAFLLLRARDLGVALELVPVLWALLHVSKVVWTWLGGELADRIPKPRLVAFGWAVYALTYLALALAAEAWHVWVIFVGYGIYYGLTEPAEKAMVKELAPSWAHGRAFGFYHFVIGITAIPAGLLTGLLWQEVSPFAALMTGAALAIVSSFLLTFWSARVDGRP